MPTVSGAAISFSEARSVRLRYGLFTGFKELQPVLLPEWLSFHLPDEWQIVWTGFTPVYMSYASWRTGKHGSGTLNCSDLYNLNKPSLKPGADPGILSYHHN